MMYCLLRMAWKFNVSSSSKIFEIIVILKKMKNDVISAKIFDVCLRTLYIYLFVNVRVFFRYDI